MLRWRGCRVLLEQGQGRSRRGRDEAEHVEGNAELLHLTGRRDLQNSRVSAVLAAASCLARLSPRRRPSQPCDLLVHHYRFIRPLLPRGGPRRASEGCPTTILIGLAASPLISGRCASLLNAIKNIVSWNDFDRGNQWATHYAPDLLVQIRRFSSLHLARRMLKPHLCHFDWCDQR
jgi:hypothetical protein